MPQTKKGKKTMVESVVKDLLSVLKRTSSVPGLNNPNWAGHSSKQREPNR